MAEDKNPLKDVIKGIIGNLEKKKESKDNKVIAAWKNVLEKDAWKHTKPVSIVAGRLIVNVSDSSRLYELTLKRRDILNNLNKEIGEKSIKEIRFKIGEV